MPGFQTGVNHNPLPYWDHLPESVQSEARFRRAIYNAQIDNMDENIGRIVSKLKEEKIFENTLILFVSDNGSSGEMGVFGTHLKVVDTIMIRVLFAMVNSFKRENVRKVDGPVRIVWAGSDIKNQITISGKSLVVGRLRRVRVGLATPIRRFANSKVHS